METSIGSIGSQCEIQPLACPDSYSHTYHTLAGHHTIIRPHTAYLDSGFMYSCDVGQLFPQRDARIRVCFKGFKQQIQMCSAVHGSPSPDLPTYRAGACHVLPICRKENTILRNATPYCKLEYSAHTGTMGFC